MTVNEFVAKILSSAGKYQLKITNINTIGAFAVKIRLRVDKNRLVDVYFNSESGKTAYNLLRKNKRVFGADNSGGKWHYHPFSNPDKHITRRQMTFAEFLSKVFRKIKK